MDVAKRVAKNTIFLYTRIVVNIFVSLFSTRIVLKELGVEDFGIYNVIAGAIGMLTFLNSAMSEASQRFMSHAQGEQNLEKQNNIYNISFFLHIIIGILVIFILELAGYFLFDGILEIPEDRIRVAKLVYHFMVISTFFSIVKVPYDAVLNAHENMFFVAISGIFFSILKLAIAIYLIYTSFDQLIVYGLLIALIHILTMLFSFFYCRIKYDEVVLNFGVLKDRKLFKEMGSFAGWSLLNHSAWIISIQGTSIVLNSFFGVVVNAAQGIANQITNQLRNFSTTMLKAVNPVIVKSEGEKNRNNMLNTALVGSKSSFFIMSLMSIPVLIEMPFILDLWLKDVPEFAVIFCRLNLIRMPVSTLTSTFYVAIGAIGDIKKTAIWESFISLCILPVSYLMFKLGASPYAIYIVLLLVATARTIGRVYFLNRLGGLSVRIFLSNVLARCVGVFLVAFSISVLPLFFQDEGFIRLVTVLILSVVSFLFSIYLFGLTSSELKMVKIIMTDVGKKLKKSRKI